LFLRAEWSIWLCDLRPASMAARMSVGQAALVMVQFEHEHKTVT
jgi:hypothetical protein